MREETLSMTIWGDDEGYIVEECPYCHSEFKLQLSELNDDDNPVFEIFCPYCGLVDSVSQFYSSDVIEAAKVVAMNHCAELINKSMKRIASSSKKNGLKINFKSLTKKSETDVETECSVENIVCCNLCDRHVKTIEGFEKFCSYCGGDM